MPDEPDTFESPAPTSGEPDEITPPPVPPGPTEPTPHGLDPAEDTGYDESGVPTFEAVREKIETRYGTSLGAAELDAETPEGRTAEEQYEERGRAAAERLEQIRKSMRPDDS